MTVVPICHFLGKLIATIKIASGHGFVAPCNCSGCVEIRVVNRVDALRLDSSVIVDRLQGALFDAGREMCGAHDIRWMGTRSRPSLHAFIVTVHTIVVTFEEVHVANSESSVL